MKKLCLFNKYASYRSSVHKQDSAIRQYTVLSNNQSIQYTWYCTYSANYKSEIRFGTNLFSSELFLIGDSDISKYIQNI